MPMRCSSFALRAMAGRQVSDFRFQEGKSVKELLALMLCRAGRRRREGENPREAAMTPETRGEKPIRCKFLMKR